MSYSNGGTYTLLQQASSNNRTLPNTILFYGAFLLYLLFYILSYSTIPVGRLPFYVDWICIGLLFIRFVMQAPSIKQSIISVCFVLAGLFSWRVTADMNFLLLMVFIVSGYGIDVKCLAKIVFWTELVSIVVVCSLSLSGLIESVTLLRDGIGLRTSLGFSHPNRLGSNVLALCCAYAVIRFPNFRVRDTLLYIVSAVFIIAVPDSRTSTALVLLTPLITFFCSRATRLRNRRLVIAVMGLIVALLIYLSLFFMVNYDSGNYAFSTVNDLFSGRLYLSHYYYILYPPTAFGVNPNNMIHEVYGQAVEGIFIDNAYAKLAIVFGYIPSMIFFTVYFALFHQAFKRNSLSISLLGAFIYACVGLTEWQVMHFAMNYCLVGFSTLLFSSEPSQSTSKRALIDENN